MKKWSGKLFAALLGLALVPVMVFGAKAADVFRIGALYPLSGPMALLGTHDMNGVELAERIRDDSRLSDLPLLMLTSLDSGVDQATSERLRVRTLSKPIRGSRLYDAVAAAGLFNCLWEQGLLVRHFLGSVSSGELAQALEEALTR